MPARTLAGSPCVMKRLHVEGVVLARSEAGDALLWSSRAKDIQQNVPASAAEIARPVVLHDLRFLLALEQAAQERPLTALLRAGNPAEMRAVAGSGLLDHAIQLARTGVARAAVQGAHRVGRNYLLAVRGCRSIYRATAAERHARHAVGAAIPDAVDDAATPLVLHAPAKGRRRSRRRHERAEYVSIAPCTRCPDSLA